MHSQNGHLLLWSLHVCTRLPLSRQPSTKRKAVGSNGLGDWTDAYTKAKAIVSQLTIREKVNITHGFGGLQVNEMTNGCAGNSGSLEKHNFPGYCYHDGPAGLSGTDMVNGYPGGIHMAATFNRELVHTIAVHTGREFKKKGGKYCGTTGNYNLLKLYSSCCPLPSCRAVRPDSSRRTRV